MTAVAEPPVAAAGIRSSPYVGLQPYGEEDAVFFFGREAERKILSANLGASRLTVLYAESGVGKSSVLRAGVASHLRRLAEQNARERGGPRVLPVVFANWPDDPAEGLTRAIRDAAAQFSGAADLPAAPLDETIAAVNERLEARPMIILDQFEEYFRYQAAAADDSFADQFVTAVNRPDLRAGFVVAIREDALARLDFFQGRIPDLLANYVRMDHLGGDAARIAIQEPLVVYDKILEERDDPRRGSVPACAESKLIDEILKQVATAEADRDGGRPAGGGRIETPHLQLVLRRLWAEECAEGSPVLRLETLKRVGGARTIMETHLDETMSTLTEAERDLAAHLFRQFVTPGGTKYAHTISDLVELTDQPAEEIGPVLDKLASPASQILRAVAPPPGRSDGYRYEITHDVLGAAVLDWRRRHAEAEKDRRVAEAEQEAREANEKHLKERRRARIFRAVMIASLVLLGLAVGAVIYAYQAKRDANAESKRSASRSAAWKASDFLGRNYRTNAALLAALEAYRLEPTSFEARRAVLSGLHDDPSLGGALEGYSPRLNAIAFSPGSGLIATGSDDGTVRLSSALTRAPIATLNQKVIVANRGVSTGKVADVAFASDDLLIAGATNSGGDVGGLVAWDITRPASPRPLKAYLTRFTGLEQSVSALAYDQGSHRLAVADNGERVSLWNLSNPERPKRIRALGGVLGIADVAISRDETVAAAGSRALRIWLPSGLAASSRRGHYSAVAFSPDGTRLAAGTTDGRILLFDVTNPVDPVVKRTLEGHLDAVSGLAFNADGLLLASSGRDNAVLLWDVATGRALGGPRTHKNEATAVAFASDGRFASAGSDGMVRLWSVADRSLATTLGTFADGDNYSMALLRGGLVAAASWQFASENYADLRVRLWSTDGLDREGAGARAPKLKHPATGESAYVVAGSQDVLAVVQYDDVAIWRIGASSPPKRLGSVPGNVSVVAISPDATRLVTANEVDPSGSVKPGLVKLWDLTRLSRKPKHPLSVRQVQNGFIDAMAFSRGGGMLATASDDGSFAVIDMSHDRLDVQGVRRDAHNGQTVTSVAFAPRGKTLATGGLDQQIKLWSIADATRPVVLPGKALPPQSNSILALAYSHSGEVLASGDGDGDVTLWDVAERDSLGRPLATSPNQNPGHAESLNVLGFSPGDRFLVAGGRHVPIVVWTSALWSDDFETLRRDVCQIVRRDLTKAEWDDFFADTPFKGKWRPTCSEGGKQ